MRDCPSCKVAERTLRRLGLQDNIHWAPIEGSPNKVIHGTHSNSRIRGVAQTLCTTYASEIAWVTANKSIRPLVYMGHPLSGHISSNIKMASLWVKWLRRRTVWELSVLTGCFYEASPIIVAPWLGGAESDRSTPGGRDVVMEGCLEMVKLFDEFWAVGNMSRGVEDESKVARAFRDLTYLGPKPPGRAELSRIIETRKKTFQ